MTAPAPARSPAAEAPAPTSAELFWAFARIAAFAFGGVLPWARFVLVDRRRWLTPDEFTDTLALCQLLPGANILNMGVAIGARFRGPMGSLAAASGLMAFPVVLVLCLGGLYARFATVPAVAGALDGMAAAAAGLVVAVALKIGEPVLRRRFRAVILPVAATFVAIGLLRLPLWPVILAVAPLAIGIGWRAGR